MSAESKCNECGEPLPEDERHGVCRVCLLGQAMASRTFVSGKESGRTEAPPSLEEIGEKFPQFDVVECLGQGGMGVVYKARQKSLDRWVAIKVLRQTGHEEEHFYERFEKEARTLARMNHPNIVTVFDHGETDGLYYIVMEHVDGVNLRDLLRDGKLDTEQALAIVPPICEALEYAHEKGVVHRDIKPENLLVDRDGRVKIADFGIASLVGAAGEKSGTPPYMAPEQEMPKSSVDHRADIYALGVVLYEMLTGERPEPDLVAPSKRVEIDVKIDQMVLRALEKEPERRYQTAKEFGTVVQTVAHTSVSEPICTMASALEASSKVDGKQSSIFRCCGRLCQLLLLLGLLLGGVVGGIWKTSGSSQIEVEATIFLPGDKKGKEALFATLAGKIRSKETMRNLVESFEFSQRWGVDVGEAERQIQRLITLHFVPDTSLMRIRIEYEDFISKKEAIEICQALVRVAQAEMSEVKLIDAPALELYRTHRRFIVVSVIVGGFIGLLAVWLGIGYVSIYRLNVASDKIAWWSLGLLGGAALVVLATVLAEPEDQGVFVAFVFSLTLALASLLCGFISRTTKLGRAVALAWASIALLGIGVATGIWIKGASRSGQTQPVASRAFTKMAQTSATDAATEILEKVWSMPVVPPKNVPENSPLSVARMKEILDGVSWRAFVENIGMARVGHEHEIRWELIENPLAKKYDSGDRKIEVRFPLPDGVIVMELAVDTDLQYVTPYRLRKMGHPALQQTDPGEFMPGLVLRYGGYTAHPSLAPSAEEYPEWATQIRNLNSLYLYLGSVEAYFLDHGSYPDNLKVLVEQQYLSDLPLLENPRTGRMEAAAYWGVPDTGLKECNPKEWLLLAFPWLTEDKRFVLYLDGHSAMITEADFQMHVESQLEHDKK